MKVFKRPQTKLVKRQKAESSISVVSSEGIRKTKRYIITETVLKGDFPGGPVVKNLPYSAGNLDLIPGCWSFNGLEPGGPESTIRK